MSHINFKPWVGKNYSSSGYKGKRILVLGESHYCGELNEGGICHPLCSREKIQSDCFSFTEDVIHDYIYSYRGEPYQQTFLCFERGVLGKELTQQEREEFWQSVFSIITFNMHKMVLEQLPNLNTGQNRSLHSKNYLRNICLTISLFGEQDYMVAYLIGMAKALFFR